MVPVLAVSTWIANVLQLVAVIIVFILVLAATYFTTRFIGKSGMVQSHSKNIEVFETFKIAQNKYIQIIKLGSKYYAIGISKENVNFLTELSDEQLVFSETGEVQQIAFKDIMEKLASRVKNKNKD